VQATEGRFLKVLLSRSEIRTRANKQQTVIVDGRSIPRDTELTADLCIIGAGAVGIAIARELRNQDIDVLVLESGGLEPEPDTQDLARGEITALPYFPLESARLRCFGGSTMHWGGWCRPFESIDFETRPWVPKSGWPITRDDLQPYYLRAQELCQLGEFAYEPDAWDLAAAPPLPLDGRDVQTKLIQFSPPTRFGIRYREDLVGARTARVALHSNVVRIDVSPGGREVVRLQVATLTGNRFVARAKYYLLAAGGIENPRLLLASNQVVKNGIGNQHDLVGRYFADHIQLDTAGLFPLDPRVSYALYLPQSRQQARRPRRAGGTAAHVMGYLVLAPDAQRQRETLNYSANVFWSSWSDYFMHANRDESTQHGAPADLAEALRTIWKNLAEAARQAVGQLTSADTPFYKIVTTQEQAPNPESRILLAAIRDPLGVPRARLQWRMTDLDRHTIRVAIERLAAALGARGVARLQVPLDLNAASWPAYMTGSWHHCGTTRMSDDPRNGVVDANLQVHGMSNLYIGGASVFPTNGNGNPTLTILALALRLADHLRTRFGHRVARHVGPQDLQGTG
jgi:choline dehydrogenase-like flavoprotein